MLAPIKDWDDAFANMAHIAGSDALPGVWLEGAAQYRAGVSVETDIAYGDAPREKLDIVWPENTPKGLAVFIHGGFWLRLDKSYWTQFAEGARALGWAVALPGYTLAPEARISHMTQQMGAAVAHAASRVKGPICLSGHSAGGHLATRLMCHDSPLDAATRQRIARTMSISGLHDLRPLMHTKMNEVLRIDEAEAVSESPVLQTPAAATPLTCWVGGGERPEFIRQSQIMAQMWEGLDAPTTCVIDAKHDHFTVIEGLKDSTSPICQAFVGL
ncbi:alpha/beta hydrolase [Tateyamaria sp.]|uniref:alpha/beta hydrolase n=1 Tax=Tateyamaria sp. TaxID=1929288 RepID=UPI00329F3D82